MGLRGGDYYSARVKVDDIPEFRDVVLKLRSESSDSPCTASAHHWDWLEKSKTFKCRHCGVFKKASGNSHTIDHLIWEIDRFIEHYNPSEDWRIFNPSLTADQLMSLNAVVEWHTSDGMEKESEANKFREDLAELREDIGKFQWYVDAFRVGPATFYPVVN